jgi:16S rRNA (adenine1518-N6/adenine1519-N6)-dimethyltransferase
VSAAGARPPPRRRRFGQHFLHDSGVIRRIADAIRPGPGVTLVEIGPGRGALTRALLERVPALSVIEVDRDLAALLRAAHGAQGRLTVYEGDALQFDFRRFGTPVCVAGNLPYNISTPLLFHLLDQADCIGQMVFMLQKEVVERIGAAPGSGAYGRLSVMVQARCVVERLFAVGPGAFTPPPRVESAVVRLVPRPAAEPGIRDPALFDALVRAAFAQRRKMLRNALRTVARDPEALLARLGIDASARPETLDVATFVALANDLAAGKTASGAG